MIWDAREHSTPHSLFEASKRERAVEPSKRKNAWRGTCAVAQVRLNTGAVLADCHQFSSLLPARAVFVPRIGVPRVHTPAVNVGGRRKACPPSPADATWQRQRKSAQRVSETSKPPLAPRRAPVSFLESASPAFPLRRSTLEVEVKPALQTPLTLPWSASGNRRRGCPEPPNPRPHHAAGRDLPDFYRSHLIAGIFSLGPCTARSLFGAPKREWGVHYRRQSRRRPRAASARTPVPRPWRENPRAGSAHPPAPGWRKSPLPLLGNKKE